MGSELTRRGRIGLFFMYDYLESFAFVRDALIMFIDSGYSVDIFIPTSRFPPKNVAGMERVTMFGNPEAFQFVQNRQPRWIRKLRKGGRIYAWLEMNIFRVVLRRSFHRLLQTRHAACPYVCLIGNDPQGLVSAASWAKLMNVPLAFWSFELLFADEIQEKQGKRLKEKEIEACKAIQFAIIQDKWRSRALIEEDGLASEKILYVPNSQRGAARRQKSDYIYQRYHIEPDRKIVLYAGMIGKWTMSVELVQAAASWPEEYLLVMQSHMAREKYWAQDYLDEIVRLTDPARVILSFDPVPASDYQTLVDSAAVGLVFYSPQTSGDTTQGKNVLLMGLSSGKMGGFLQSGLPIIVNKAVIGPKELVQQYRCGICVDTPDQIGEAINTVFRDYNEYSSNAIRCFDQEWELETHFKKVIERIDQLSGRISGEGQW